MAVKEIAEGNLEVIADVRRILGGALVVHAATPAGKAVPVTAAAAGALTSDTPAASSSSSSSVSSPSATPSSSPSSSAGSSAELKVTPEQLCASILHTVYMGTGNSSVATRSRSQRLAEAIGSYHNAINIDAIVSSVLFVFTSLASVCTASVEMVIPILLSLFLSPSVFFYCLTRRQEWSNPNSNPNLNRDPYPDPNPDANPDRNPNPDPNSN